MNISHVCAAAALLGAAIATGCGGQDTSGTSAPRQAAEAPVERSKDFGDYVLHFNALTTDQLTAEVASNYGIPRSKSTAMLNITIIRKEPGTLGQAVTGTVTTKTTNLTGQLKNLELRPLTVGDAIYYVGSLQVADREVLVFDIEATPDGETSPMTVRFQQQFYTR